MKDILWDLFNKTGNINYYLFLSRIRDKYDNQNQRNCYK